MKSLLVSSVPWFRLATILLLLGAPAIARADLCTAAVAGVAFGGPGPALDSDDGIFFANALGQVEGTGPTGVSFSNMEASCFLGGVSGKVFLFVINNPSAGVGFTTRAGGLAQATSTMTNDFVLDGGGIVSGPVETALNLEVDGVVGALVSDDGSILPGSDGVRVGVTVTSPNSLLYTEKDLLGLNSFDWTDYIDNAEEPESLTLPVSTDLFMAPVNTPLTVVISLAVDGEIIDPITAVEFSTGVGSSITWNASFDQTVTFSESGPVWNVPAGVSVVSEITPNNTYTRPPAPPVPALNPGAAVGLVAAMLVGGSIWLGRRSHVRA